MNEQEKILKQVQEIRDQVKKKEKEAHPIVLIINFLIKFAFLSGVAWLLIELIMYLRYLQA